MADGQIDPARLSGEALKRWYLRKPEDVERERQAAGARQQANFFGGIRWRVPEPGVALQAPGQDPDSGLALPRPGRDTDLGFGIELDAPGTGLAPGFSWIPAGENRWRRIADANNEPEPVSGEPSAANGGAGRRRADARTSAVPPGSAPQTISPVAFTESQTCRAAGGGVQPNGGTYRTPATPPKPSFLSFLFGGPAPITSPEGNVVGYYDHDVGKVAVQITAAYAEIAPLFHPAGWMDVVGTKASTPVLQAIDHGILEALQRHHPVPQHMGGRWLQELAPLRTTLHAELHSMLRTAFKEAGFPNVGGRAGSQADWIAHFEANPDSYSKALEILQRVTREFDKAKGTNVTTYLDRELAKMAARTQRRAP